MIASGTDPALTYRRTSTAPDRPPRGFPPWPGWLAVHPVRPDQQPCAGGGPAVRHLAIIERARWSHHHAGGSAGQL